MKLVLCREELTGVVEWRLEPQEQTGDSPLRAKSYVGGMLSPNAPIYVHSDRFGSIRSDHDIDTTIVPGTKRYGSDGRGERVFCLEYRGSHYLLTIAGCPLIAVRSIPSAADDYRMEAEGREIAWIRNAPELTAQEDCFGIIERAREMYIDDAYLPFVEILAAVPVLIFYPLRDEAAADPQPPKKKTVGFLYPADQKGAQAMF